MNEGCQALRSIKELCRAYNIGEKTAINVLGKYGEIYNIKLLFSTNGKTYVPDELFSAMERAGERIDEHILPVPEEMAESVPTKQGSYIYFLFTGGSLIYIGQTVTLLGRLSGHYKDKEFDHFAYVEVEHKKMDIIESANILYYKPALNCMMKGSSDRFKLLVSSINVDDLRVQIDPN